MTKETDTTIEMVNVGVTAKIVSPVYDLCAVLQSSSTDTDNTMLHTKYSAFLNKNSTSPSQDTMPTSSDNSKTLYQLKAINESGVQKVTPSKLEFQLYRKSQKRLRPKCILSKNKNMRPKKSHSSIKRLIESESKSEQLKPPPPPKNTSFLGKLKKSLGKMKNDKTGETLSPKAKSPSRIDVYPFDHGCAEYLRTTDFAPQIISELLAQRASDYATRFWAEFFGSLHIGVALVLTFFLQTYRFVLHSLVKSVVVGFLQMTSDYCVKPLLTVLFNGFLQPSLIFAHNILSSVRDVLKPVAETLNSFLKPWGNLLKSVRLVTVKVDQRKGMVKSV